MRWPPGPIWYPIWRSRRGTRDLRWLTARAWSVRWYPQGIDVGSWKGHRTLAVSWFRQNRARQHLASRVALIDLDRSRHLDIALAVEADQGELVPARIHAGGLAWFGDRLFVAATNEGIWEFDLANIRRVRGRAARRLRGARGWGIFSVALVSVRVRTHPVGLRCSFLGRVFADNGEPLRRIVIGEHRIGEHRIDDTGQLAEFDLPDSPDGAFVERSRFAPGIPRMQGSVRWGDRTFVSQSVATQPGRMWSGQRDSVHLSSVPLPVGCQDLALDPEERMLWTLGEHPWQRVVRGIPFDSLGLDG